MNSSVDTTHYTSVINVSNTTFNKEGQHKRIQSSLPLSRCNKCLCGEEDIKRKERNKKINSVKIDEYKIRRDIYGTLIVKGSKQHKISFIDNVVAIRNESVNDNNNEEEEIQLVEIVKVQSYKKYNEAMSFTRNKSYLSRDEVICCEAEGCVLV